MVRSMLVFAGSQFLLMRLLIAADDIEPLIDDLVKITEPDVGYSSYFSGSIFLPYGDSEQLSTLVFGGTSRERSVAMTQLVSKGAEAAPFLIKHLTDDRPLAMKPIEAMMWTDYRDEYDFNSRVSTESHLGINRESFTNEKHPGRHALTVGDMCFVALGQIVNRNFSATRYQPTGGLIVSSPVLSKHLRQAILKEWSELTPAEHRRRLVEDFQKPDSLDRRIGAYLRLSYYYPDAVEPIVLKVLKQQPYDEVVVFDFCRDVLYKTTETADRKKLYDEFLMKHGAHFAEGVEQQLFDDLESLEFHEEGRIHPPLKEFSTQPREVLIQLSDRPPSVRSTDRPFTVPLSEGERTQFIAALTHDSSKEIGEVVKEIVKQNAEDKNLTAACYACLANRGEAAFLVERLDRIDFLNQEENWEDLQVFASIASSREPAVKKRLQQIIEKTKGEGYFVTAIRNLKDLPDPIVLENAMRILRDLPAETEEGYELLDLIVERFPDNAKGALTEFLGKSSAPRCETVCRVLWYGHPLSMEILAPMLDDRRELAGFTMPLRVCDRAAQAISHTSNELRFDSDWGLRARDNAIELFKEYCEQHAN